MRKAKKPNAEKVYCISFKQLRFDAVDATAELALFCYSILENLWSRSPSRERDESGSSSW